MGHDELLPVSDSFVDNNGHVGLTLIDSLDTLWYMGLKDEFNQGVDWVIKNFQLDSTDEVSIWEYGARLLGGLLSAYELSGNELLLVKSVKVGDLILSAIEDNSLFPAVCLYDKDKDNDDDDDDDDDDNLPVSYLMIYSRW